MSLAKTKKAKRQWRKFIKSLSHCTTYNSTCRNSILTEDELLSAIRTLERQKEEQNYNIRYLPFAMLDRAQHFFINVKDMTA